jgi:hypothetical protein
LKFPRGGGTVHHNPSRDPWAGICQARGNGSRLAPSTWEMPFRESQAMIFSILRNDST